MASLIRSEDGTLLRSGSALGALSIWVATANNKRLALDDETLLAVGKWASATVASAWGAQGAWPDAQELRRMQRAGRRPPASAGSAGDGDGGGSGAGRGVLLGLRSLRRGVPVVDRSPEGDAIVCGDVRGHVAVFRWPASSSEGAGHRRYAGHGCPVDAVGFSWDDRFVLTIGRDGSSLLWRHWNEPGERELSEDDSDAEEERASRRRHLEIRLDARGAVVGTDEIFSLAQQRAADRGARLRAMPQWLAVAELFGAAAGAANGAKNNDAPAAPPLTVAAKAVPTAAADVPATAPETAPAAAPAAAPSATVPDEEPHLAWVHGYRGHDCRHNVAFSADGDAVYPAASVVVLAGVRPGGKRQQRFFRRHTDDVLCLAAHPSRRIFASGQKAFARGGHGRSAPVLV